MGVFTSGELFTRKTEEETGKVYSGGKPKTEKFVNADKISYRFPTPVHGTSMVFLDVDGESTKVKLDDGIFTIPKSWKIDKKKAYKQALVKAGFEEIEISSIGEVKKDEVEKSYIYFAGHPDNKDDEKVEGKVSVEIDGEVIELEVLDGIVTTEDKAVYAALIEKGFYEAKSAKEISE